MGQALGHVVWGHRVASLPFFFMPFISIPPPLSSGLWWVGRGKGFCLTLFPSLVYTPSLPSGSKDWLRICCPSLCLGKQLPDTVLQAAGEPLRQQVGPSGSKRAPQAAGGPLRQQGGPSGGGGALRWRGAPQAEGEPSGSRGAPQAVGESLRQRH